MFDRNKNIAHYLLCFTILVSILISGCKDSEEREMDQSDGRITLTYWPAPNPQEMQLADSLVRLWNEQNPHIRVRMQSIPVGQSTEEVLLASIAAGTTPDICSNIWPGALYDYTRAGGLIPFDRFADFDSVITSRVPDELVEMFRSPDGSIYQIPWKTNPVMMIYNKRILRELGYENPPRTYSEYLNMGRELAGIRDRDRHFDVWMGQRDIRPIWWQRFFDFLPFYYAASGGKMLFDDETVAFVNDYAVKVMTFFRDCYRDGVYPIRASHQQDPFLLEKMATNFAGSWQIPTIRRYAPHIEYGVAPLPIPDDHEGPVYTYGDFKNIAIFSNTRHPDAAWEFVKFLITAEHDLALLEIANQIPVRGDLLTNPLFSDFFTRDPDMMLFAEQAIYTRSVDEVADLKEILDALSQEYEAAAVYGRRLPEVAIRNAARRAELIIEWNK
jgi:multiple sugar transport system substrate-binding protein